MKRKDKLKGGVADKCDYSKFNKKELKKGTKVEREHTKDKKLAREIAGDHLAEHKDYYKELAKMEKKLEKKKPKSKKKGAKGPIRLLPTKAGFGNPYSGISNSSHREGTVYHTPSIALINLGLQEDIPTLKKKGLMIRKKTIKGKGKKKG